jgi:SPP1 family predicted phage head-tail adaptor
MSVNAGRLDQRITLQEPVQTRQPSGEVIKSWADVATVWASADPKRGAEYFAALQMQAEGPVMFRIRWRSGVLSTWRVVWRGANYDIASPPVDAYGMKESLDLYCVTGVRDGR